MVWRIESGRAAHLDLAVTEQVPMALGVRALLTVEARHLVDRRRQRDGVHAHLNGYVARRLSRLGWHVATKLMRRSGATRLRSTTCWHTGQRTTSSSSTRPRTNLPEHGRP